MDIFIYSDESGVLDKYHNDFYVFGGVIFLSSDDRDNYARKYIAAEKNIRISEKIPPEIEVKASNITPKSKNKLYRAVMEAERFGVVIDQNKLTNDALFQNKKSKQRYLDWAYKIGVKRKLENLISRKLIIPNDIKNIYFFIDEHSTATDGIYELRESLEKEFKIGIWNFEFMSFYPPLFPNLKSLNLQYCNSSKKTLVRAADIVANHLYYRVNTNAGCIEDECKLNVFYHP